jgi:hypothetical protein
MSVVVVLALLGSVGLEPVGAAGATGPDPSLVGIWNFQGTSVTISIGGQKAIDPLCEPDIYCITTPNTSSMGGIFFAEDISLTANGAGNWVYTCIGCTGWETITGHFTGSTKFTGKAVPGPTNPFGKPLPYSGYKTTNLLPPSMSLSISPQSSTLAVGEILNLTLTVKAGPVNLTNVSIGGSGSKTTYHGLDLSPTYVATISQFPSDLSGFALAAFASRKFAFRLTGAKAGTVKITAFATANSAPGGTHGSAEAQLSVGDISDYTLNIQASIPQSIIVDPSSAARYNTTSDNGPEGYNHDVPFLKALMGPELEYPECLSPSEVREDTEKKLPAEWYSYYLGNTTLAKVTIPLQWDESAQEVTLNGGLDWKEYDLTRVFKYRIGHLVYPPPGKGARVPIVVYDTPQEECEETVPVRMLVAVVPGGDYLAMARGLSVSDFTIITAWEFPGAPAGAIVNPEPSLVATLAKKATTELEALFGPSVVSLFDRISEAHEVYEENTPAVIKFAVEFGISYFLAAGVVAAVAKVPAVLANGYSFLRGGVELSAATLAEVEELGGLFHTAGEGAHTGHSVYEILEGLEQFEGYLDRIGGAYPIMSAVIRGHFSTEYGEGPDAGVPQKTLLAVSVHTTKFPNIWLTVSRKTQAAATGSSVHPFNGVLPWSGQTGGQVAVDNPFGANPAGLVNGSENNGHDYLSGEEAVDELVNETGQNPAVESSIRYHANLVSGYPAEESEAPTPYCNSDGKDLTGSEAIICWLITDGPGPNDHRA